MAEPRLELSDLGSTAQERNTASLAKLETTASAVKYDFASSRQSLVYIVLKYLGTGWKLTSLAIFSPRCVSVATVGGMSVPAQEAGHPIEEGHDEMEPSMIVEVTTG